ncbi:MAG TPA: penicillin-binding transpeptidase domain-containing protein, partial [Bryobacteraceae bacterium]|nr:penicillin-binding transpeptidase domain-containing protein [Bryobacteraceae bacterium]
PLQLASAIGGLAMGGVWYKPHLVKSEQPEHRIGKVDAANVQKVIYGMWGVVNEGGGTGGRARLPGVSVCGKTGSAQRLSNEAVKAGHKLKDNAWFVAFAPCEAPEIAISVLWEGGEHGMLAAPVAKDVLKAYFDKKAREAKAQAVADMNKAMPPLLPSMPDPKEEEKPEAPEQQE